MKVNYESTDKEISEALKSSTGTTVTLKVDGEDFDIYSYYTVGGERYKEQYVYADGTLYAMFYDSDTYTVMGKDQASEYAATLKEQAGPAVSLNYDDFEQAAVVTSNGVSVITCTDIKDAPLAKLVQSLEKKLSAIDAHVAIKDASLAIQIKDGRYDITILTCDYVITVGDDVYTITMTYSTKFDYSGDVVITAPKN